MKKQIPKDDIYKALEEAEDIDLLNIATVLLDQGRTVPPLLGT